MSLSISKPAAVAALLALAAGCAPATEAVCVGRIVNTAEAEARLVIGTVRSRTPAVAAAVEVMGYRPETRAAVAKGAAVAKPAKPETATGLAAARVESRRAKGGLGIERSKGAVRPVAAKGEVAVARAKGVSAVVGHKSAVTAAPRKGAVVVRAHEARLRLVKYARRGRILPGDRISYLITLTNVSELPVTDVVVLDSYPAELKLVRVAGLRGHDEPSAGGGGVVRIPVPGALDVGQSVSFEISFRIPEQARVALEQTCSTGR